MSVEAPEANTPEVLESDRLAEESLAKFETPPAKESDPATPAQGPAPEQGQKTTPEQGPAPEQGQKTTPAQDPAPEQGQAEEPVEPESKDRPRDSGHMIPKYRYDARAAQARRAEEAERQAREENERLRQELEALRQPQAPAGTPGPAPAAPAAPASNPEVAVMRAQMELNQLNRDLAQATANLKTDDILRLQGEIQTKMFDLSDAKLEAFKASLPAPAEPQAPAAGPDANAIVTEAQARMAYSAAVEAVEAAYPQLNVDDEKNFNQAAAEEVTILRDAYLAAGRVSDGVEALEEAVSIVAAKYGFAAPAPAPAGRQTNVQRNVDVANRQPPDLESVGHDSNMSGAQSSLPDITKLSDEEFDALPEETKARMRGDNKFG